MNAQNKSGCGCLGGGCLAFVVVFLVLAGAVGAVGFALYQKAREYTSAEAVALPVHEASAEEIRDVTNRVEEFKKAVESNGEAVLELSGDDINTLIAGEKNWQDMKGKVFFRVSDGLVHIDASVPLTQVAGFSDRYLNGTVGFEASVVDGRPKLLPKTIDLNGKKLPKELEQGVAEGFSEGFVEELEKNPNSREFFSRVKSLTVAGDKVRIHMVPMADSQAQGGGAPPPTVSGQAAPAAASPPVSAVPSPGSTQVPPTQNQANLFVCGAKVMAYDRNMQPLGFFLQGSTLEILGASSVPGMVEVRFREPGGRVIESLCKAEDVGMSAPEQASPKPEFQGLGGSQPKDNPNYKGFGQP